VSEPILAEYRAVLSRPKFSRVSAERRADVLSSFSIARVYAPEAPVAESPDEPDNRFLECAEAAAAEYLVTGNARHFPKRWKRTRIVNARQFLNALEE
jgi:predicted nucleic acid-binding protein